MTETQSPIETADDEIQSSWDNSPEEIAENERLARIALANPHNLPPYLPA